MPEGDETLSPQELAAMGVIIDGLPIHQSSKLASVGLDHTEALYMLATYCFDLQRKMQYLYRVLARVGHLVADRGLDDPQLQAIAKELLHDEETLNGPGLTWRQRAEGMEKRMIELHAGIERDRDELLKRFAAGKGGASQGA